MDYIMAIKKDMGQLQNSVDSRFLKPPRERKIGWKNREFEKSKVTSNYAKYC